MVYICIAIVIAAIALKVYFGKSSSQNTSRPANNEKPSAIIANDKLIMVNNVSIEDITKALTQFCNQYNNKKFAALPRLTSLKANSFAVTYPYDTDFATYCFAVNYLRYPADIKWNAEVTAWTTTKQGDEWISDKSRDKKIMLFIADDDKEYDNVCITTEDNIGYKLGFAGGKDTKLLDVPVLLYKAPSIRIDQLAELPFTDFE